MDIKLMIGGKRVGKLNTFSYLFLFIAVITQIIEFLLPSSVFYYNQYLKFTLLIVIVSPIIGIILGLFGKRGNHKLIAIALNAVFFVSFSLLALLNLWIITFGK
jgi:hypothetical protein